MKSAMFTLVLIAIFVFVYIKKTGISNISIPKLLFIPAIFIVAYFIDKRLQQKLHK